MFKPDEVTYGSLLEQLGGQEWLELMINAYDFEPFARRNLAEWGLVFTFQVQKTDKLRMAKFIPVANSSGQDYRVRMTIDTWNGLSFELAKPYHHVVLIAPHHLQQTFTTATSTALTF